MPVDTCHSFNCGRGLLQTVDNKSGPPVLDDFGHRTPPGGDDRRSAGHGFDHRQSEWILEIDQVEKRMCAAENHAALFVANRFMRNVFGFTLRSK